MLALAGADSAVVTTQIGFFRGDVLGLLDDIQALQPTIFVSVPRLWNRIHDRVAAVRILAA